MTDPCEGNPVVTGGFLRKGQVMRKQYDKDSMFSFTKISSAKWRQFRSGLYVLTRLNFGLPHHL